VCVRARARVCVCVRERARMGGDCVDARRTEVACRPNNDTPHAASHTGAGALIVQAVALT
jgi:hypothetical protein